MYTALNTALYTALCTALYTVHCTSLQCSVALLCCHGYHGGKLLLFHRDKAFTTLKYRQTPGSTQLLMFGLFVVSQFGPHHCSRNGSQHLKFAVQPRSRRYFGATDIYTSSIHQFAGTKPGKGAGAGEGARNKSWTKRKRKKKY